MAPIPTSSDKSDNEHPPSVRRNHIDDAVAMRVVKLIQDLDVWIISLRRILSGKQPWERALAGLLGEADRCMQILRMSEAMMKPDSVIAEAAVDLASACRRMELAIRGSRADAFVRHSVRGAGQVGTALCVLILQSPDKGSTKR